MRNSINYDKPLFPKNSWLSNGDDSNSKNLQLNIFFMVDWGAAPFQSISIWEVAAQRNTYRNVHHWDTDILTGGGEGVVTA